MPNYKRIDVPRGTYIGWGNKPKQHVTGTVLEYDPVGGTDFNNKTCPLLEVELTERAASFNKELERTNYEPGEVVMLTCGPVALKRAVKKAEPERGDAIKIVLGNLVKVPSGTVKEFEIFIAKGEGKVSNSAKASKSDEHDDEDEDDEPPF